MFLVSAQLSPVEHNGRLHVDGTNLCNESGYPIQLRGMSTHGLQWFEECITPSALDVLAYEWGADILRLSLYARSGGYESNPSYYTELVDRLVDEVGARGMYALIDWHQLSPGDPNEDLDNALIFWEHMSKEHGHKKHVLFDICNEPNGSDVDWWTIKRYADTVIPVIRENAPNTVIIVGTPNWASRPNDVIGNEINDDNIMYTMHFYAASHGEGTRSNLEEALDNGIPVFVTEFGTQEASGDGGNDFWSSQQWMDLLDEYKISWCNWNFSDDHRTGAVWESGTCGSEDWDDGNLKEAGIWVKDKISNPPDDFGDPVPISNLSKELNRMQLHLYPNPFKNSVVINIKVLNAANTSMKKRTLEVVNVRGITLFSKQIGINQTQVKWNGTDMAGKAVPKGFYIIKVSSGGIVFKREILKL